MNLMERIQREMNLEYPFISRPAAIRHVADAWRYVPRKLSSLPTPKSLRRAA